MPALCGLCSPELFVRLLALQSNPHSLFLLTAASIQNTDNPNLQTQKYNSWKIYSKV